MQKDSIDNRSWKGQLALSGILAGTLIAMMLLTGCSSMSQDSAGNPFRFNPKTGAMGSPGWDY